MTLIFGMEERSLHHPPSDGSGAAAYYATGKKGGVSESDRQRERGNLEEGNWSKDTQVQIDETRKTWLELKYLLDLRY